MGARKVQSLTKNACGLCQQESQILGEMHRISELLVL